MRDRQSIWRRLLHDQSGSEIYENALVFGVLVLMAVMVVGWIGSYVHDKFADLDAAEGAAQRQTVHVKTTRAHAP